MTIEIYFIKKLKLPLTIRLVPIDNSLIAEGHLANAANS